MIESFLNEFTRSHTSNNGEIPKENLIILDPDFLTDYAPKKPVGFSIPVGYKLLYAQDIQSSDMPLILKRAKIVLDLALPGPERISGEGILVGAIPIIADKWNGGSLIDFPGLFRVNPMDGDNITSTLQYVADNYEELLATSTSGEFLKYILSMNRRLAYTTDVSVSDTPTTHIPSPQRPHIKHI